MNRISPKIRFQETGGSLKDDANVILTPFRSGWRFTKARPNSARERERRIHHNEPDSSLITDQRVHYYKDRWRVQRHFRNPTHFFWRKTSFGRVSRQHVALTTTSLHRPSNTLIPFLLEIDDNNIIYTSTYCWDKMCINWYTAATQTVCKTDLSLVCFLPL